MKKEMTLCMTFLVMVLLASAQDVPPQQVTDAFSKKFTGSEKVAWGQESPAEWEAEFVMAGVEKSAIFSPNGEWLETESEICRKDLPAEIFKTLAITFDGFEIEELAGIEKPGFTGYEIALEKRGTSVEILAMADGTFTLSEIKVEDECDKESPEYGRMDCCKIQCCKTAMQNQCRGGEMGCYKANYEGCPKTGSPCKVIIEESCEKEMKEGKEKKDKDKD